MGSSRFIPIIATLLLSACAEGGVASLLGQPTAAEAEPKAGIQQVELAARASEPQGEPANPSVDRPQASTTEPPVDDNPHQLVGLGPSTLAERLGSPGFVRRDGPAEIWQYAAEACILDVFLYRDGDAFTVSHVALRGHGAAEQSRRECFAGMLRSQSTQRRS